MAKNDSQRCFPCDQYNKSYDISKALDCHRHTKHNPHYKDYSCAEPMCKVISASRTVLNAHMLIHTAISPYQCKLCGKAYKQKTTLHDHMIWVHEKRKISNALLMDAINHYILNTICWHMFVAILERCPINANSADFVLLLPVGLELIRFHTVMLDHMLVNIVELLTNKRSI